ncbi:SAM-dependent DNA methyltransferase [Candidatus Poribacteria bacterium]|nr:SAM-dependent DNA methyltransferase [Candidatus Poribacteria bacterium]
METPIGQVFTPTEWAEWLINKWNIFDAWMDGAEICDPTAGQGAFIIALLNIARNQGIPLTPKRLSRLTLIEIDPSLIENFKNSVKQDFGIDFPHDQLFCKDIITRYHDKKYDILIGNPPWVNFSDLPTAYKTELKPYFIQEGLVQNTQKLLLGSSRMDVAALVIKTTLGKLLKKKGLGYFYLPTSLFFGDGAHAGFRDYSANKRRFSIDTVYEFTNTEVFGGIQKSYCCGKIQIDSRQTFPIPYYKEMDEKWDEHIASPLKYPDDPWRIVKNIEDLNSSEMFNIYLSPNQKPRQGVNTCGANNVFIFDDKPLYLPDEYLYPLATKEIWRRPTDTPHKWILLPYHQDTGKPLDSSSISRHDTLMNYLQDHRDVLQARKGTLLKNSMNRSGWWILLGVGPYAFAPYKVIWEAYGRKHFNPIVVSDVAGQVWQGNQSLQAYIPCWDGNEAHQVKTELENPEIPKLLRQLNGSGKCNWAQPGKIKKILNFGLRISN